MQTFRMARAAINQLPQLHMNSYALMSATEQIDAETELKQVAQALAKIAVDLGHLGRKYRASEKGDDKLRKIFMDKLFDAQKAGDNLNEAQAIGLQKAMDQLKNNLPPSASSKLGSPDHAFILAEKFLDEFDNRKNTSAVISLAEAVTPEPTLATLRASPVFTDEALTEVMQDVWDANQGGQISVPKAADHKARRSMPAGIQPDTPDPARDFAYVEDFGSDHEDEMVHLDALYREHCPPSDSEDDDVLPPIATESQVESW